MKKPCLGELSIAIGVLILPHLSFHSLSNTAEFLLNNTRKIYVIDESRCSANKPSCEGGKAYLIEGNNKIMALRNALKKMIVGNTRGGCLCGGPDIHYFRLLNDGTYAYIGLDCNEYLNSLQITNEVRNLINPSSSTFLGAPIGYVFCADVSLEEDEGALLKAITGAGYFGLVAEARADVMDFKAKETAPVVLELKMRREAKIQSKTHRERQSIEWRQQAEKDFNRWVMDAGLTPYVLQATDLERDWSSDSKKDFEVSFSQVFYLNNAEKVRPILSSVPLSLHGVIVNDVEFRSEEAMSRSFYYEVFVITQDACSSEEKGKLQRAVVALRNIRPICERHAIQ